MLCLLELLGNLAMSTRVTQDLLVEDDLLVEVCLHEVPEVLAALFVEVGDLAQHQRVDDVTPRLDGLLLRGLCRLRLPSASHEHTHRIDLNDFLRRFATGGDGVAELAEEAAVHLEAFEQRQLVVHGLHSPEL